MKRLLRKIPGVDSLIQSSLWRSYRHNISLRTDPRKNSNFTGFLRLPTQFDALSGPVVDFVRKNDSNRHLRIAIVGSSIGAEAYTVASVLSNRHPDLDYSILGCDIEEHVVDKARGAVFDSATEVFNNKRITSDFIASTFNADGASYRVKEDIRRRLTFFVADVLNVKALEPMARADIVFAQNFLFHLEPHVAVKAFENIYGLMAETSALFVDGTDLPLRLKLTRKYKLAPLDYKIEEIHNEARWARAVGWPYHYWGLEPFMTSRRDWRQRYATIFLRGAS